MICLKSYNFKKKIADVLLLMNIIDLIIEHLRISHFVQVISHQYNFECNTIIF